MAFDYDFLEYIGADFAVGSTYKTIPKTTFTPTKKGLLIPKIYVNVDDFTLKPGVTVGAVLFQMVRENPTDPTFKITIPLHQDLKGMDICDTRTELKSWPHTTRRLHFEVKAVGTTMCRLNQTTYVSYAIIT